MRKFFRGGNTGEEASSAAAPAGAAVPQMRNCKIHKVDYNGATYHYLTYINPSNSRRMREIRFKKGVTPNDVNSLIEQIDTNPEEPRFTVNKTVVQKEITQEAVAQTPRFTEPAKFRSFDGKLCDLYLDNYDTLQIVTNRHHDRIKPEYFENNKRGFEAIYGQGITPSEIENIFAAQRFCRDQVKRELDNAILDEIKESMAASSGKTPEEDSHNLEELLERLGLSEEVSRSLQGSIHKLRQRNDELLTENLGLREKNIALQEGKLELEEFVDSLKNEVGRLKQAEHGSEALYFDASGGDQSPEEEVTYMSVHPPEEEPEKETEEEPDYLLVQPPEENKEMEIAALREMLAQEQEARQAAEERVKQLEKALFSYQNSEAVQEKMSSLQNKRVEALSAEVDGHRTRNTELENKLEQQSVRISELEERVSKQGSTHAASADAMPNISKGNAVPSTTPSIEGTPRRRGKRALPVAPGPGLKSSSSTSGRLQPEGESQGATY